MKNLFLILVLVLGSFSFGQNDKNGIPIQGQFLNKSGNSSNVDLLILILSNSDDTLYAESHLNVKLDSNNVFKMVFGQGQFEFGPHQTLKDIHWISSKKVKLFNFSNGQLSELIGSYSIQPFPYAYHSLSSQQIPSLNDLIDTPSELIKTFSVLKFNGSVFTEQEDILGDLSLLSQIADSSSYSDTSQFSTFAVYADSSHHSQFSDSSNFVWLMTLSPFSDSTIYVDSIENINYAIGNWGLKGNNNTDATNYAGTIGQEDFALKTNNSTRLIFSQNDNLNNTPGTTDNGFSLTTNNGVLMNATSGNTLGAIPNAHLYFDGSKASFRGGGSITGLDTLMGKYSFVWGKNVGTNGTNSTIFGKNSFGDSAVTGSTTYNAISSFAFGKNCRTARMGVAIGEDCQANTYRNVAIGKKAIANKSSSSVAMGDNVLSTGATAWAAGQNVSATGHFSTAMGTNATTNLQAGCFIYGDNSTTNFVNNTAPHQFMVRASGGVIFYSSSNATMGVELAAGGGSWNMVSDRNKKFNIHPITPTDFSNSFDKTNVYSWTYKNQELMHIGPMAQDFNKMFDVGEYDNYINMLDIDGIIFMGIKQINQKLDSKSIITELSDLEQHSKKEQKKINDLESRINVLYEKVDH